MPTLDQAPVGSLKEGQIKLVATDGNKLFNSGKSVVGLSVIPEDFGSDIQLALNEAIAKNTDLVLLSDYTITTKITGTIDKYLGIVGPGRILSTLSDDASGDGTIQLAGASTSRLNLKGFSLKHTYVSGGDMLGLKITSTLQSVYAENIEITGFPQWGVESLATTQKWDNCTLSDNRKAGGSFGGGNITLDGLYVKNNGNGVDNTTGYGVICSGTTVKIFGGEYRDNDRYGIDVRRANDYLIDGAYVYNSGFVGIYGVNENSEKDTSNGKIVNSTVDMNNRANSDAAVWIGSFGADSTVAYEEFLGRGNTIKNAVEEAFLVGTGSGSNNPEKVILDDNIISDCAGAQVIKIGGAASIESAILSKNIIKDSGQIQLQNVENVIITELIYNRASGNSQVITCTGDLKTRIKNNIINATIANGTDTISAEAIDQVIENNGEESTPWFRTLTGQKKSLADNTATTFINVVATNAESGGTLLIDYVANDVDKGDVYLSGQLMIPIVRYPGVVAVAGTIVNSIAQQTTDTGSGFAITNTVTFGTVVTGAVGADNTIAIQVTADVSDNLTSNIFYAARFLCGSKNNNNAVRMTLAAA